MVLASIVVARVRRECKNKRAVSGGGGRGGGGGGTPFSATPPDLSHSHESSRVTTSLSNTISAIYLAQGSSSYLCIHGTFSIADEYRKVKVQVPQS